MYLYLFLCLQNTGAEIGEFLTPLIFLCHSYKKWTLGVIHKPRGQLRGAGGGIKLESNLTRFG